MNLNIKLPPDHSLVETADGSFTLYSELFQEACHSTGGAKSETETHYINGCEVIEKSHKFEELTILEVGFGLGMGFLTTLERLGPHKRVHFISLELDRNLLEWFRQMHTELKLFWDNNLLLSNHSPFKLSVIQGDARVELPEYLKNHPVKFHAIYQDAFSPKKNPHLWTKEWFELLKSSSHEEVILSTYSASTSIRKSLHETGWGVQKGEKFGPKKTSTRAVLNRATDPEILEHLNRSPVNALMDLQIASFPGKIK